MLQNLGPGKASKLLVVLALFIGASTAFGQSAAFTYQGRLTDGGAAANGIYDMQFKLYDTATVGTGTQIGSTITKSTVMVTSGVFTVDLDFGSSAFPGASRFLGIAVRANGSLNPYTELAPRQPVTSTPYAVRTANATAADTATNATQLGGVAANQYVLTSDSRLTDSRSPTPGSSNYIQNTTSAQAGSNFNISGNGTAGGTLTADVVNAATQYNIGGNRVLSTAGADSLFTGVGAGRANTTGNLNAFFGFQAGSANTIGVRNSFFGANAGQANTAAYNSFFGSSSGESNITGFSNSFFGMSAGSSNVNGFANSFFGFLAGHASTASNNSFFGSLAGQNNTAGLNNSFFGAAAGVGNTEGLHNSFFGGGAGIDNTLGNENTFVGTFAGSLNTTGSRNTFLGRYSSGAPSINNATAIGYKASVTQSNSLVLGSISGLNDASADVNVGIGTTTPNAKLQVTAGDVYVQTQGNGIILRATDATKCFRVTVNSSGTLSTTLVTCP